MTNIVVGVGAIGESNKKREILMNKAEKIDQDQDQKPVEEAQVKQEKNVRVQTGLKAGGISIWGAR